MNRLRGEPPVRCEPLTESELAAFKSDRCPDCRGSMREGPHGGLSVNWICNRCGRVFNSSPLGVDRIVEHRPPPPEGRS